MPPGNFPVDLLASAYHLPKSNQGQEVGISQTEIQTDTRAFARQIPDAARESIWAAADGHAIRRLDWSTPDPDTRTRGNLLFMAGRGDAYEKYLECFEHWRRQGWRVTACDWRGQGGSGRLGKHNAGHIDSFSDWVSDLAGFWRGWAAEHDGPNVLVGHSMGGHLTLRAAVDQVLEPKPDALVLSAPMLDVFPEHLPLFMKRAFAKTMLRLGDPTRPAWGNKEKPVTLIKMRRHLLTHDEERYEDERWWREQRPELVLGPGSWGWVNGAMDSIARINERGAIEAVDVPVFMLGTTADRLVSPVAIRRATERLPDVEALTFGEEARHEILRETDAVRDKALAAIDDFLERRVAS